ncbi:MAG: plasmid pRiA4b ORF-3 family protein, partial [Treponema sp.]|nr:plasmid pRiA4b ORF-3 family protein [Treponema sp.]
ELLPQEYRFFYHGKQIPFSSVEGPPEEFYPYYTIFGEEYAPQYVAKDNPNNESAFNSDPYEDPPDVSIQTLDMRNLYRELAFVPGDRFVVGSMDWKQGVFFLERVGKDEWSKADLYAWQEAAEEGFEDSFKLLGPGETTEEQIAYAYWYGGERMRNLPAYALEDFLYEQTNRIETTPYGIETRFWFAGKEIPDIKGQAPLPVSLPFEDLRDSGVPPLSEYVVHSYVCDAFFRRDKDIAALARRIIPPTVNVPEESLKRFIEYVTDLYEETLLYYSPFTDAAIGPVRQRLTELHTAVIDLTARLGRGDINIAWLPKHTFVILSQIQSHAAGVLEDMDMEDQPTAEELEAMDNSLDSMIETYEDIKELIDGALSNFRQNNLSVVRAVKSGEDEWRTVQVSLGGADVWRRVVLPERCSLKELHRIIQALFGWKSGYSFHFALEEPGGRHRLDLDVSLGDLDLRGGNSFLYEYGSKWTVKILLLSRHEDEGAPGVRCVAGSGSAPPEYIDGPMRFRRYIVALESGADAERTLALRELGEDFDPQAFDLEACNRRLSSALKGE